MKHGRDRTRNKKGITDTMGRRFPPPGHVFARNSRPIRSHERCNLRLVSTEPVFTPHGRFRRVFFAARADVCSIQSPWKTERAREQSLATGRRETERGRAGWLVRNWRETGATRARPIYRDSTLARVRNGRARRNELETTAGTLIPAINLLLSNDP